MDIIAARPADIEACLDIYAHHVLHGTGTFEETSPSLEDFTARFHTVRQAGSAWLVARDGEKLLGYAYYAQFRPRSAYRFTAENSVYIRHDACGRGTGKALLTALLAQAGAAGFKQMLALIGDTENTGSIRLHTNLGFRPTGTMQAVGYKFGRWLDVVTMQKSL